MNDYLFAVWVDRNTCKPFTGIGRVGHVVRVSLDANMTIINEFATEPVDLSHVACAPSSLQSWFLDKTQVRTTIAEIESLADTTFPNGTSFVGVEATVAHFHGLYALNDTPYFGYIMNPGGGFIEPPTVFASYLAARQGGNDCLQLVPPPFVPPVPKPTPVKDEDVARIVTAGTRPTTEGQDPHGNGAVYLVNEFQKRWIPTEAVLAQYTPVYGAVQTINAFVLDAMFEDPDVLKRDIEAAAQFEAEPHPDTE